MKFWQLSTLVAQGTNTLGLQKLSTVSWFSKPFFCHFSCQAVLMWSSLPAFQRRNRQTLTLLAREFIPPHQASPVAAVNRELRSCSSFLVTHSVWMDITLPLHGILAAWLLSMFGEVARNLMSNFLYWYFKDICHSEFILCWLGCAQSCPKQRSTNYNVDTSGLNRPDQQIPTLTESLLVWDCFWFWWSARLKMSSPC